MLSQIRAYLASRGRAPLGDIALHLEIEPSAARGMLEHLMRKGRVRCIGDTCQTNLCSKGCGTCNEATNAEFYELVEE